MRFLIPFNEGLGVPQGLKLTEREVLNSWIYRIQRRVKVKYRPYGSQG